MIEVQTQDDHTVARARSIRQWGEFIRSELEVLDDAVSSLMRAGAVGTTEEDARTLRRHLEQAWDVAVRIEGVG